MTSLYLQSISQELVTHQSVIDNVEEKGKTLQSPTVAAKLETLREQYKHLCKVVQVERIFIITVYTELFPELVLSNVSFEMSIFRVLCFCDTNLSILLVINKTKCLSLTFCLDLLLIISDVSNSIRLTDSALSQLCQA